MSLDLHQTHQRLLEAVAGCAVEGCAIASWHAVLCYAVSRQIVCFDKFPSGYNKDYCIVPYHVPIVSYCTISYCSVLYCIVLGLWLGLVS